jgi:GGDEF domain-containing protein
MLKPSPRTPEPPPLLTEDEVVDLADIDLDFAVEEALHQEAPEVISPIVSVPASVDDLAGMELFKGLDPAQLAEFAPLCQSVRVVPGYVLHPMGRFNTRLYCVRDGQLRMYVNQGDKRPRGIVDVDQSCGLALALAMQPADYALIATEETHLIAIELTALNKFGARSHVFAQNYAALMASYTRGDHCLLFNERGTRPTRRDGYIDPATLLHNQSWLDAMLPRIIDRTRQSGKSLSLVALRVDGIENMDRDAGVVMSPFLLEALGRMMVENSRPTDLHVIDISRRLLVILPDSNLDGARALAYRLREHAKELTAIDELPLPAFTLSMSIASLGPDETGAALLERAETLIRKSVTAGGGWLHE